MDELDRSLSFFVDEEPFSAGSVMLVGREKIGLYPDPFTVRFRNLPEEQYLRITRGKRIDVCHGDSCLVSGGICDVFREGTMTGMMTSVVFSSGMTLWETPVSLAVPGGASVSETVRMILEASGAGVSLLSFPGEDFVFSRGQSFFGRAAECITAVLSAVRARAVMTTAGLCVIPAAGLPVSLTLTEKDLTDAPAFAGRKEGQTSPAYVQICTKVIGFRVGQMAEVEYQGKVYRGLIVEREMMLDTISGSWSAQILIELQG